MRAAVIILRDGARATIKMKLKQICPKDFFPVYKMSLRKGCCVGARTFLRMTKKVSSLDNNDKGL